MTPVRNIGNIVTYIWNEYPCVNVSVIFKAVNGIVKPVYSTTAYFVIQ